MHSQQVTNGSGIYCICIINGPMGQTMKAAWFCCQYNKVLNHLKLRLKGAACQQALYNVGPVQAIHAVASEDASLLSQWLPIGVHHEVAAHRKRSGPFLRH